MNRSSRIGIAVGLVLVLAAIVVAVVWRRDDAVQVRIETVSRRDLVATVTASGWIRPQRRVDVQADLMGRITQLSVREGEQVVRGQVLLRIDPTQYEAAVGRALATVSEARAREAQARASHLQAERQYSRLQQMADADANLVSAQQLEEARTQFQVETQLLEAAGFGVAQARSGLAEAQDRLSKTIIRAPMDGMITRLNVDEGETAIVGTMNNAGSLLLTVADLSVMEAIVQVDETDLPQVQIGDSAAVLIDAFPRQRFAGTVSEIKHSAVRPREQQAATGGQAQAIDFEVVIRLHHAPPTLRSDLSVSADIVTDTRDAVLAVPIIALTVRERGDKQVSLPEDEAARYSAEPARRDGGTDEEGVFVIRDGRAEFVPVEVGIAGQEHFEIIHGIMAGDSVVAGPYDVIRTLESGTVVRELPAAQDTAGRGV